MAQRIIRLSLALGASIVSLFLSWPYWRDFEYWAESRALWLAYYNAERPHSTHGILPPDEDHASKIEPMRMAAWCETLIHLNRAANWSKKQDHLYQRDHHAVISSA